MKNLLVCFTLTLSILFLSTNLKAQGADVITEGAKITQQVYGAVTWIYSDQHGSIIDIQYQENNGIIVLFTLTNYLKDLLY